MKTCGNCEEFMGRSGRCGNPMVYLNHDSNVYQTTAETAACGFYRPLIHTPIKEATVTEQTPQTKGTAMHSIDVSKITPNITRDILVDRFGKQDVLIVFMRDPMTENLSVVFLESNSYVWGLEDGAVCFEPCNPSDVRVELKPGWIEMKYGAKTMEIHSFHLIDVQRQVTLTHEPGVKTACCYDVYTRHFM